MCTSAAAKNLLYICNFIFFILGAACIIVGAVIYLDNDDILGFFSKIPLEQVENVEDIIESTSVLHGAAIALIIAGCIIFGIAFLGCCGARKNSRCLLCLYAVILLIILFAQIAATVLSFVMRGQVENSLQGYMKETIQKFYTGATIDSSGKFSPSQEPVSTSWDFAMAYFECCGADNYNNFASATRWNRTYVINDKTVKNAKVPVACCTMIDHSKFPTDWENVEFKDVEKCVTQATDSVTNKEPCYDKIKDLILQYSTYVIGVALAIAVLEIILIVAACIAIKNIDEAGPIDEDTCDILDMCCGCCPK